MDLTPLWFGIYKAAKYALYPLSWIAITGLLTLLTAWLPMTPRRTTWVQALRVLHAAAPVADRHTALVLHVHRMVGRMVPAVPRHLHLESRRHRRAGRRCVCEGIAQADRGCLGFLTPTHDLWRRLVATGCSRPSCCSPEETPLCFVPVRWYPTK